MPSAVVHALWRKLPARFRQSLYRKATETVAPRAAPVPLRNPAPPFVVAGPLRSPSGIGEAARLAAEALASLGVPVFLHDLTRVLRQPEVIPLPDLPRAAPGPGTLLAFVQPPNVAYAMYAISEPLLREKYRIGCWVWDLEVVPEYWRRQLAFVHELAAPSRFVAQAFARAFQLPVRKLVHPVAARSVRRARTASNRVRFAAAMDLGSTVARKNPLAVLRAFRAAFSAQDDVELLLKLRDVDAAPRDVAALKALAAEPGAPVRLQTRDLDMDAMAQWWQSVDVLVSLHRSEGFGLLVAEAMLHGIPVIATDWSATSEYVDDRVGWPVPAALIRAQDETRRYQVVGARWAEPDPAAAVRVMREAAASPPLREQRGRCGRERAELLFGAGSFLAGLQGQSWITPADAA